MKEVLIALWLGILSLFGMTPEATMLGGGPGTINQLEQWKATSTPSAITQNVYGKPILITGLDDGCVELLNGLATTTTGLPCGSGSGGGGLSTTSPFTAGDLVQVVDDGTVRSIATSSLGITSSQWTTNGSNIYYNTGNVGIGTTSPYAKLSVNGGSSIGPIIYSSGYQTNSPIYSNTWIDLGVTSGHAMGAITLNANSGAGVAGIGLESADANNGNLTFSTRGTSVWAERMRITSAGNVGIGTTTPTEKLVISGNTVTTGTIFASGNNNYWNSDFINIKGGLGAVYAREYRDSDANTVMTIAGGKVGIGTTSPYAKLSVNGGSSIGPIIYSSGYQTNSPIYSNTWIDLGVTSGHAMGAITLNANSGAGVAGIGLESADANNGNLTFSTRGTSVWAERMRITSAGNVGIGTTTPTTALHVIGTTTTSVLCLSTDTCRSTWPSGGGGITSLNSQTGSSQTFATGTATGIGLTITSGSDIHTFTPTVSSGYNIPLTASTTEWATAYASTTALSPAYIRSLFSATSPLSYSAGNFSIANVPTTTISAPGYSAGYMLIASTTASGGWAWVATSTLGISGGGGGSTNYWSLISGGLQTSTSTDFARAAYFVATSTTATSTFPILSVSTIFSLFGNIYTTLAQMGTALVEAITSVTPTGAWNFNGATVKQHTYKSFTWPGTATTTSATTTVPMGTAYTAEAWNGVDCWVTNGSGPFIFTDGTNRMNGATATTTVARTTLSTNNTFTAGERRYVEIGPLTAAMISCTVDVTVNN